MVTVSSDDVSTLNPHFPSSSICVPVSSCRAHFTSSRAIQRRPGTRGSTDAHYSLTHPANSTCFILLWLCIKEIRSNLCFSGYQRSASSFKTQTDADGHHCRLTAHCVLPLPAGTGLRNADELHHRYSSVCWRHAVLHKPLCQKSGWHDVSGFNADRLKGVTPDLLGSQTGHIHACVWCRDSGRFRGHQRRTDPSFKALQQFWYNVLLYQTGASGGQKRLWEGFWEFVMNSCLFNVMLYATGSHWKVTNKDVLKYILILSRIINEKW